MKDSQTGNPINLGEPGRGKGNATNKPYRFSMTHPNNKPQVAESIAAPLQQCICLSLPDRD